MNAVPELFHAKEACCGCGACLNICPANAITMQEDEGGFIYPVINTERCIRCGCCKTVCAFQNREETNSPIECFAAVSTDEDRAKKSASAGIFAAIALSVLKEGGIVYGAAFDELWGVHHIGIEDETTLEKLQGSKYAHSNTERTFSEAKKQLQTGRKVLYSGTPCQIAGFKEYLGKEYENLITVDIVCHGVPSVRMLKDYLRLLEEKHGGKVEQFTFRDKSIGWGINGCAVINGKKVTIWQSASSYLYYFTKGWIYRENCYTCKYACEYRPADLTIGDYWGIEKQHPEFLGKNGWDETAGISLLIANTRKGADAIEEYETVIDLKESTFSQMAAGNAQLRAPSQIEKRDEIVKEYVEEGWKGLEKGYKAQIGYRRYSSQIKSLLPAKLKRQLKKHFN